MDVVWRHVLVLELADSQVIGILMSAGGSKLKWCESSRAYFFELGLLMEVCVDLDPMGGMVVRRPPLSLPTPLIT